MAGTPYNAAFYSSWAILCNWLENSRSPNARSESSNSRLFLVFVDIHNWMGVGVCECKSFVKYVFVFLLEEA